MLELFLCLSLIDLMLNDMIRICFLFMIPGTRIWTSISIKLTHFSVLVFP